MLCTSPQKLKSLDLSSIQQRLVERKRSLSVQRRQYTKRWKCAKEGIGGECKKHLDKLHQSCDLQLSKLATQLQCDIKLVKSLRSLKAVERDVSKMLELAKRASKSLTLCVLPTITYRDGAFRVKLSDLHVVGLSELIGETPHRCFSSGVVGLVASYINTTVDFEGKCCFEFNADDVWCVIGLSGGRFATGHINSSIHVWDSQSGKRLFELKGHSDTVYVLANVDGDRLLSGGRGSRLRLWDLQTGHQIRVLNGHTDDVDCVCVFADSNGVLRAASGSHDATIRIWDLDTGVCIKVLRGHTKGVRCLSVTTDGSRRLVSGSWDKTVRVWDTKTGECLKILKGHTKSVDSVLALVDQKRVDSVSDTNTIRVWDIETGECLRVLKGHTDWIQSVSVFADGQRIVSGSYDKHMRVWNMDTGECLKVVKMDSKVWEVCCLEEGRVISITINDRIQIWE